MFLFRFWVASESVIDGILFFLAPFTCQKFVRYPCCDKKQRTKNHRSENPPPDTRMLLMNSTTATATSNTTTPVLSVAVIRRRRRRKGAAATTDAEEAAAITPTTTTTVPTSATTLAHLVSVDKENEQPITAPPLKKHQHLLVCGSQATHVHNNGSSTPNNSKKMITFKPSIGNHQAVRSVLMPISDAPINNISTPNKKQKIDNNGGGTIISYPKISLQSASDHFTMSFRCLTLNLSAFIMLQNRQNISDNGDEEDLAFILVPSDQICV